VSQASAPSHLRSDQFTVLSEPKLRADQLLFYLWRATRPEADDVRQLRAELAQSRELLLQLTKATRVFLPAPATERELQIAAAAAREAVVQTFRAEPVEMTSEEETDPDAGASHRLRVAVEVDTRTAPKVLAEARSRFFKLLGEKLPPSVSAKVAVVLDLRS
jgi:hypothetical protein